MSSKNRHDKHKRMRRSRSGPSLDDATDTETKSVDGNGDQEPTMRRRQASVYDAVAGSCAILTRFDAVSMVSYAHSLI